PFFVMGTSGAGPLPLSLHDALPICLNARVEASDLKRSGELSENHALDPVGLSSNLSSNGEVDGTLQGEGPRTCRVLGIAYGVGRSEEHTSELQSRENIVCRLLLDKK